MCHSGIVPAGGKIFFHIMFSIVIEETAEKLGNRFCNF